MHARRGGVMDTTERRQLIERYAEGYEAVTDALQGTGAGPNDHRRDLPGR